MSIVGDHDAFDQLPDDSHPGADIFGHDKANEFALIYGDLDASAAWILVDDDGAQAKAAALCEPDGVAIFALHTGSFFEGSRPDGLDMIDGKDVLFFPFGDAAKNHNVFELAATYGTICEEEGASDVRFVWLGPQLDAHLGERALDDRKKRLASVIKRTGLKPAKQKPKGPTAAQKKVADELAGVERKAKAEGRPVIDVNGDRGEVLDKLVDALKNGVDGDRLFNFGGELACLGVNEETGATEAELVDDKMLLNLLTNCSQMISVTTRGVSAAWPETKTMTALYGRHHDFRTLRGIAPSPIVRKDNTIASEAGYDEASQVLLDLDGHTLDIPDDPTDDEIDEAVALLLDEWLGDFPLTSAADRANLLAFILSYPLRELVDLVPLAVFSARSKGTGKSKLVSLVVLLFTRTMPAWDSLPSAEDETRKQITTLLSTASPYIGFDESPVVGGKSINRLLTARMWSDRVLGGNKRATLPNRAVMASTGNNVEVLGDTGRRYYPIELFYEGENPEDRPESDFKHPDVEAWTLENRDQLLAAVFTLIRAWQVAGRPKRGTSFGSFERWESVLGGVIANARVDGFLDNLREHRASSNFEEGLWVAHCEWLARTFRHGFFSTRQVIDAMVRGSGKQRVVDPAAELPPDVEGSPLDPGYAASLGRLYNARHGGWSGGYRIGKASTKAGKNAVKWTLEKSEGLIEREAEEAEAAERAEAERLIESADEARSADADTTEAGIRYEG
jgi:hypothetical protein